MVCDYELVIRNVTIADGTGVDPRVGDVAISGGQIAAVGRAGVDEALNIEHRSPADFRLDLAAS
jgi:N-acyl-D-aspartate/D-glutamate deacylase